jgi:hypothetical protein
MTDGSDELSRRVDQLERRTAAMARWWVVSLVVAAAGGVWLDERAPAHADAPPAKDLILADGDAKLELHPWGLSVTSPTGETTITTTEIAVASTATKRRAALAVNDKNAIVQLSLQASADRAANLVVGGYTELELQGDASSVDLRAAEEARIAAKSDAFTYAEMTAKGALPCWTLGVKTGTATRTCNDKK